MRFYALVSFIGLAVTVQAASSAPGSSAPSSSNVQPTPAPTYNGPKPNQDGTCDVYAETCYVTVTASHGPYAATNGTSATPVVVGTGSAATPTKAYYSNAANPLSGGAMAVGAGILGALFL